VGKVGPDNQATRKNPLIITRAETNVHGLTSARKGASTLHFVNHLD